VKSGITIKAIAQNIPGDTITTTLITENITDMRILIIMDTFAIEVSTPDGIL